MTEIKVLFLGDVYARAGKDAVRIMMPALREKYKPDVVIANAENIAGGFGITENLAQKLFRYGVDVITLGNHTWNKRDELGNALDVYENLLRPANYPPGNPGHGWTIFSTEDSVKVGVINLMGRVYMPIIDCPFRIGKEKVAMGYFLDGLVSAVVGTHTHIQTADEKILPGGTAYITDCGMTGPHDSVIGVKKNIVIDHFLRSVQMRFEPASGGVRVQGVFIKIDAATGFAKHIERVDIPVELFD